MNENELLMPSSPLLPGPAAVVIGASAGAVEALTGILPQLRADFPLPLLVVVHIPQDRPSTLPEMMAGKCRLQVKEAEDKEAVVAGTVYFAPPNYHLQVEPDFTISLSSEEPVLYSRPSIDVLFESAADAYGDRVAGLVLTGANHDGAAGLRCIGDAGGLTLVQDPATANAAAMPQAALAAWPNARLVTLDGIPAVLNLEIPLHFAL